jgi:1,4-dihydroxy-2-naphthoate octaprenyltransferase
VSAAPVSDVRPVLPARASVWLTLHAFVRLGRPLFLTGGFVLYALGAALAHALTSLGAWSWSRYALGQAVVTAFQLMTHYANDYFDYEADCANATPTRWSGGSRVLASGTLPIRVALLTAIALGALGALASLAVVRATGGDTVVMALLLAMGVLSWQYSGPPLRLHSTGWGELNVAVVVTGLVPALGFALQGGNAPAAFILLLALLPLAALQFAMLLAIEFPDARGDAAVGKRTLVVRLGPARAARWYNLVTAAAYLFLPVALLLGLPAKVAAFAASTAPIALYRIHRMRAGDFARQERWETVTFWGVALLVATSVAELIAVALLVVVGRG